MSAATTELPWSWEQCARGWEGDPTEGGEHDYWLTPDQIEGDLPASLRGTLLRNGPGGIDVHGTALQHPIDGDGLVCALAFDGKGGAHFRSRFVRSRHRVAESEAKQMLYRGQMGSLPPHFSRLRATTNALGMLTGLRRKNLYPFRNPSNTNVLYWSGKLLTAYETHLPHRLNPQTLETEGREDFGGALSPVRTFAAHFRADLDSGNLVTVSARPAMGKHPAVILFSEFDKDWNPVRQQLHHIEGLNYIHDFAMTPNYLIVQMTPFVKVDASAGLRILSGQTSPGEMMRHYPELPSRIVVIPRHKGTGRVENDPALQPVHLEDVSPVHIFHFGTAYETDTGIDCTAVCLSVPFDMTWEHGVWLSNTTQAPGRLCRYTLTLPQSGGDGGALDRVQIDPSSCEFPVADFRHHGSPQQRVYLMANDRPGQCLPYRDIVQCDPLGAQPSRQVWHSEGIVCEPTFAPRHGQSANGDDGWILVQVFEPGEHRTQFVVLDGGNVAAGPVCRLHLPHHVPLAFHTTFTPAMVGIAG
jgi:all-trans-8'-apo-beta-carotenal 15,15'-oxygenase